MDADLDTLATAFCVRVDDLWTDSPERAPRRPRVGITPKITDAELITLAVMQALLGYTSEARWLRYTHSHPQHLFRYLPQQPGYNKRLRRLGAERIRAWWRESALLVGHFGAYLAAVFLVLPVGQALAFVAVHQGLLGVYLGCSFAPSHKGMPRLRPGEELGFLQRQVLTSRNIRGGRWLEVVTGGLNYQIEHHLFPSMPSPSLRRARPLVRAFCASHHLAYHEPTLIGSYAQVLRYLHDVGASARPRTIIQLEEA